MKQPHVVLLQKNLEPGCLNAADWINKPHTRWISFGHFDEILIYKTDAQSDFLSSIAKDKAYISSNSDAATYYHPLYLMLEVDKALTNHNERWFIAIVRIHLSSSQRLTEQFRILCNSLERELSSSDVSYKVYHATDFSDMVIDIRTNHFSNLLDFVLLMRKHEEIGKMYSHFGINATFLSTCSELPTEDDKIPLFSMRFSGTDLAAVMKQITVIKATLPQEQEYSVNGVDDILLVYRNIPTASVVKLYRHWLFREEYSDIQHSESVTRIGVNIEIERDFSIPPQADLLPLSKKLLPLCSKISNHLKYNKGNDNHNWFIAVSKLAHALVRMSKTPVMDEAVFLLAPQIEAFLENLLFIIDDGLTQQNLALYYYYIESCTFLMEQLIRIEGQLSQQPEMRPTIYDIPVFMLEYTVAFLNKISSLLQMSDPHPNKQHVFLLVPRPCELISAIELFRATPTLPGVVYLQIPEQSLYSPSVILKALCHEISHYVGEKYRNRSSRSIYYARAAAAIMVDAIFQNKSHSLINFFELIFRDELCEKSATTIQEMHTAIKTSAESIFSSTESLSNIIKEYVNTSPKIDKIVFPRKDTVERGLQRFIRRCEDLNTLFREIYADICMIYLLDIQTDDYIGSLLQELSHNSNPIYVCDELFAIRIYVSLVATNKLEAYQHNKHRDIWVNLRAIIANIDKEICEETDGKFKLALPISSIYTLLDYAKLCFETISTTVKPKHTDEVRQMLSCLTTEDFAYHTVLAKIEECRTNMVDYASSNN